MIKPIVIICLLISVFCSEDICTTNSNDPISCVKESESYEAIKQLHLYLDNDKNGEVDIRETSQFAEGKLENLEENRAYVMHEHDASISLLELWQSWRHSEVHNWTTEEVVDWLINHVGLSQYVDNFLTHSITGVDLPKFTLQNSNIYSILNIKNLVHRQKLLVKAMDLVLFGPTDKHSKYSFQRDATLILTLIFAFVGFCFFVFHSRKSKKYIDHLLSELGQLSNAGDSINALQSKLAQALSLKNSMLNEKSQMEKRYKEELQQMERDKEVVDKKLSMLNDSDKLILVEEEVCCLRDLLTQAAELKFENSKHLLVLLQISCEIEKQQLNKEKASVEKQLSRVKEQHMRILKKKSSLLGAFRLDLNGNVDNVEADITDTKEAVARIKQDITEHQQRWLKIEKYHKMDILTNPGLKKLLELQKAYSSASGETGESTMNNSSISSEKIMSAVKLRNCSNDNLLKTNILQKFNLSHLDHISPNCDAKDSLNFIKPFAVQWKHNTHRLNK